MVRAAVLLGLGVAAVLVYQAYHDDFLGIVSADPPYTDVIEGTDFNDGNGVTHASKVRYNRTLNPWEGTVYWVNYGGRYNASGCVTNTRWRNNGVEYKEWDGSRWVLVQSSSAGSWLHTGNNPGLAYDSHYQTVDLDGGGLVIHKIRYKWYKWCLPQGIDINIPGLQHEHYLE